MLFAILVMTRERESEKESLDISSGLESCECAIDVRGGTLDRSPGVASDNCANAVCKTGNVSGDPSAAVPFPLP